MCDNAEKTPYYEEKSRVAGQLGTPVNQQTESHMVYELKQKREYLLRQIVIVQQAIDAVNLANNF